MVPVKEQCLKRKFSERVKKKHTLVLDALNIHVEVQQNVLQIRPRDKDLDIFSLVR